jgi:hypothetical protein
MPLVGTRVEEGDDEVVSLSSVTKIEGKVVQGSKKTILLELTDISPNTVWTENRVH